RGAAGATPGAERPNRLQGGAPTYPQFSVVAGSPHGVLIRKHRVPLVTQMLSRLAYDFARIDASAKGRKMRIVPTLARATLCGFLTAGGIYLAMDAAHAGGFGVREQSAYF